MTGNVRTLGPTRARNWGWASLPAIVALLLGATALEAAMRVGLVRWETLAALAAALPFGAVAVWMWRQPPFERTTLIASRSGLRVEGRKEAAQLRWDDIAAVTHRPSSMGPHHMTIERAAESLTAQSTDDDRRAGHRLAVAPGVMFPVRATGASVEDIVAFIGRAASEQGFALTEAGRGDGRAVHRFPGPRRWILARKNSPV